jgi:hypothetical protein
LSISIAYYQYFHKSKDSKKRKAILFFLRALSLFLLLLLLINPTIKKTEIENIKPVLSILIDNSSSTQFFNEQDNIKSILNKFENNDKLNSKFNLNYFSFGKEVNVKDSLSFNEAETNISKGIKAVNDLYKNKNGAIVLLSDGNQTTGNDYEFSNSKKPIYPLVIGDTIKYKDVSIRQLNVNKYSYLKNKFPVEIMLFYEGNEAVTTQFSIYKKGKTVFTQKVRFSATEKSKTIIANLTSTLEGLNFYKASVRELENEKNTNNNSKNFSVEVINEQTKILLVSSILHPDLGALKKSIESNKQRSVDIILINKFNIQKNDYQLVILYQPNNKFNFLFNRLKEQNLNFLLISGAKTDWDFINNKQLGFSKNSINQTENYGANYNNSFLTFLQKDIGFNNFPPLKDKFGEIIITKEVQKLLYQNIIGINSQQPLLATFEENSQKFAVIFGEGIWKWRAASFLNSNSFQDFDEFTGSLVQYLASNKKRNRLEVNTESLYPSNSTIVISAFYTDKNYNLDQRASLLLSVTNIDTKELKRIPFSLVNNSFQVAIEDLPSGNYSYKVTVEGQNINKVGRFLITESKIEEQFTNANSGKLNILATKTGGKRYYPSEINNLIDDFNIDNTYVTTQKYSQKEQNLIDWKWILFLVIILLTVEWFTRKYFGKI